LPGIRPVIQHQPLGGAAITALVSRRLSARRHSLLGHPVPARGLGLPHSRLTGRPSTNRTLSGFPCFPRMRYGWGRVSSIPRGRRCPHGRECSPTVACRIATAQSLSARHYHPTRTVTLTRHPQGFPVSHPIPSLPLTCGPRTERGPLGFPVSFAPGRHQPRTSRWGQVLNTDPKPRRRHQPTSIQRTHSPRATSRRRHYAYLPAFGCPITWPPSPCFRFSRTPRWVVTPTTNTGPASP
jgi:hypothetical protein